jgi:hypothetical protein
MSDAPQFFSYQGYSVVQEKLVDYASRITPADDTHQQTHQQEMIRSGTIDRYAFSSFQANEWPEMTSDTETSSSSSSTSDPFRSKYQRETLTLKRHPVEQIAFGSTGSGLSWHRHSAAWNSLVVGRKLWFFSDPSLEPPPGLEANHTSLSWFRKHGETYRSRGTSVLSCVVSADDRYYVYVPNKWWHATINLGEVVSRSQRRSKTIISRTNHSIQGVVATIRRMYDKSRMR